MDYPKSSLTLPASGSMRNGVCSARPPLAPPTAASGSGSWATPKTTDSKKAGNSPEWGGGTLTDQAVRQWPTPATFDATYSVTPEKYAERAERLKAQHNNGNGAGMRLGTAAQMWPTPAARNAKGAGDSQLDRNTPGLPILARQWPTPRASMNENRTTQHAPSHGVTHGKTLAGEASHHHQATTPDGPTGSPKVDLNPEFVAALMGLPPGWLTPYTSAETDSSPSAPAPPGNCSPNDSGRTDA